MAKYSWVLLSVLLVLHCTPTKWARQLPKKTPTQSDFPNAGAVVMLDEASLRIDRERLITYFSRCVIIKILNESGWKYADIEIPFSPETVIEVKGRTMKKDGTILTLKKDEIYEKSLFPDYILYSDVKVKTFTLPGIENGCVIQYEYTKRYEDPIFSDIWTFQWDIPVIWSRYYLTLPTRWRYKSSVYPKGLINTKEEWFIRTLPTYIWEVKDMPAIEKEPYMPPFMDVTARLVFSCSVLKELARGGWNIKIYETWDDVAEMFYELANSQFTPNNEIKEKTQKLIVGLKTDLDKIKTIFNYIQNNIRYVAIEIGEGRRKPTEAEKVFEYKYGDCKDMVSLLIAMLKVANIKAYPVLLRTKDKGKIDISVPTPLWFNHVIACVPMDTGFIWLDPTAKVCPVGIVPPWDEGVDALIVMEKKAKLKKIPESEENDNIEKNEFEIKLFENGSIECKVTTIFSGNNAIHKRRKLKYLSPKERQRWIKNTLLREHLGPELLDFSIEKLNNFDSPVEIKYNFISKNYATKNEGILFLKTKVITKNIPTFYESQRKYPVFFFYRKKIIDIGKIVIPENYRVRTLPKKLSIETPFTTFLTEYKTNGKIIEYRKELIIKETKIPVNRYLELKEFFEKVLEEERQQIVFEQIL